MHQMVKRVFRAGQGIAWPHPLSHQASSTAADAQKRVPPRGERPGRVALPRDLVVGKPLESHRKTQAAPAAPPFVISRKTLAFSLVFRFPEASRAARPHPHPLPAGVAGALHLVPSHLLWRVPLHIFTMNFIAKTHIFQTSPPGGDKRGIHKDCRRVLDARAARPLSHPLPAHNGKMPYPRKRRGTS